MKSVEAEVVLAEVAAGKAVLLDCRYARDTCLYGIEPALTIPYTSPSEDLFRRYVGEFSYNYTTLCSQ